MFFAYPEPSKTDRRVIGTIKSVLAEYRSTHSIEIIDWRQQYRPGLIVPDLHQSLKDSDYIVCYLSERLTNELNSNFVDNPNVIFEAGIVAEKSGLFENIIILREENSTQAPFDLAQARTISIPRDNPGSNQSLGLFNEDLFITDLKEMLNSWFPQ